MPRPIHGLAHVASRTIQQSLDLLQNGLGMRVEHIMVRALDFQNPSRRICGAITTDLLVKPPELQRLIRSLNLCQIGRGIRYRENGEDRAPGSRLRIVVERPR